MKIILGKESLICNHCGHIHNEPNDFQDINPLPRLAADPGSYLVHCGLCGWDQEISFRFEGSLSDRIKELYDQYPDGEIQDEWDVGGHPVSGRLKIREQIVGSFGPMKGENFVFRPDGIQEWEK